MDQKEENRIFWEKREQEAGGKVIFKTVAKLIGQTNSKKRNLSGIMYVAGTNIYFEDFEKTSSLDFLIKRKQSTYQKFLLNFPVADVCSIRKVSASSAEGFLNGTLNKAKPPTLYSKLFGSTVWEIQLSSNKTFFFETFDPLDLIKITEEH